MGWSNEEPVKKEGMDLSSKILLAIIGCVILIIIIILVLLMNIQQTTYTIQVDQKTVDISPSALLAQVDGITYVNIEEFAKLVNYEYHKGEYKTFTIEDNKCYVQSTNETASFYLNDNKVRKLPVNNLTEDYREYTVEQTMKSINEKMYAPIDAITIAFNVVIEEEEKEFIVFTLDNLVSVYDKKVKEWGYTGISDQNFENKKSLLYGYLIVRKENGLYKIIDTQHTKEIVSDRYNAIQFTEYTQEFFVTNSLGQVGIINLDGTTKIEPIYESITVLNKEKDLYIVQKDKLFGIIKSGNITLIYPEYDQIGCTITSVEVNGIKKVVNPVTTIEECNGIVVKKANKYGLINIEGNELVPIAVDSIYEVDDIYYMLYNGEELNVIERLKVAGLIKDSNPTIQTESNTITNTDTNQIQANVTSNAIMNNTIKVMQNQVMNETTNNTTIQ